MSRNRCYERNAVRVVVGEAINTGGRGEMKAGQRVP